MRLPWIVLLAFGVGLVSAQRRPIESFCDTSDAVVVAEIERQLIGPDRDIVVEFRIIRSLKGDLVNGSSVRAIWRGPGGSLSGAKGYSAIWFMRRDPRGLFEIEPIAGPKIPILQTGLPVPSTAPPARGTRPLAACSSLVVSELVHAVERSGESPFYETSARTLLGSSVRAMPEFSAALAQDSLKSVDILTRVAVQDVSGLTDAARSLARLKADKQLVMLSILIRQWASDDTRAVEAIGAIASSNEGAENLKLSGAEALMRIHSAAAVPFLADFLSTPEPELHNLAVKGLSLFVNGAPPLISQGSTTSMSYLVRNDKASKYLDASIEPYVTVIGIPPGRRDEFVHAWRMWWSRMRTAVISDSGVR